MRGIDKKGEIFEGYYYHYYQRTVRRIKLPASYSYMEEREGGVFLMSYLMTKFILDPRSKRGQKEDPFPVKSSLSGYFYYVSSSSTRPLTHETVFD